MLRNVGLWIISILLMITAHAEIHTTMPDFPKFSAASLAPIEVSHVWTAAILSKNKLFSEKTERLLDRRSFAVVALPSVQPFVKKSFIQQTKDYYSHQINSFHLII